MIESFHRIRKKWPGLLNKKALSSVSPVLKWVLAIWIFTAIFADQIANDLPLSCTIDGQRYFPALEESWNKFSGGSSARLKYIPLMGKMESVVMPPVPYSPQSIDRKNAGYKSPFGEQNTASTKERHWLGTDALGRDVLSGLIHGSRLALVIGFLSVFIAAFLGIVLGAFAGYYGDRRFAHGCVVRRFAAFLFRNRPVRDLFSPGRRHGLFPPLLTLYSTHRRDDRPITLAENQNRQKLRQKRKTRILHTSRSDGVEGNRNFPVSARSFYSTRPDRHYGAVGNCSDFFDSRLPDVAFLCKVHPGRISESARKRVCQCGQTPAPERPKNYFF